MRGLRAACFLFIILALALGANATTGVITVAQSGQTATLTVTPSGGQAPYFYIWYGTNSQTCSSTDTPLTTDPQQSTYSVSLSPLQFAYYCVWIGDYGSGSTIVQGTPKNGVFVNPVKITPLPFNPGSVAQVINPDGSITMTATPSGGEGDAYSYQWRGGTDSNCNNDAPISGAPDSGTFTLAASNIKITNNYYCAQVTSPGIAGGQAAQSSFASPALMTRPSCTYVATGLPDVLSICLLALIINAFVVALGYMIGQIFPSTGIREWIRMEFWEMAKSALIIVGIVAIVTIMSNIAYAIVPVVSQTGSGNPLGGGTGTGAVGYASQIGGLVNGACSYLSYVEGGGIQNTLSYMIGLSATIGAFKSLSLGAYLPIPPLPVSPVIFMFGFVYSPYVNNMLASEIATAQYESLQNDILVILTFPMALLFEVQSALLPIVVSIGLVILIPVGLIMRSFPFIRGIGGTLIAIGIGAAIIYPSLLVLLNYPVTQSLSFGALSSSGTCSFGNIFICGAWNVVSAMILGPLSDVSARSGVSDGLNSLQSIYPALNGIFYYNFYLVLQLLLFILDTIIAFPLIDGIARMLGGTIRLSLGGKLRFAT